MRSVDRIYLSPPHMSGFEQSLVAEAFASNWIAPVGPHVDAFENEFCATIGARHAAALSSGTAALHLALKLVGVDSGDDVLVSTLTFSGSVNPILYLNARPVFVDSERRSWNMNPVLLGEELQRRARRGSLPAAVVVVHLYGQSADMAPILEACNVFGVPVVEDAAEALGATYSGFAPGTLGRVGIFSFNGNKIITTSGGGMLVSAEESLVARARKLATQARDPAPHYQHSELGYNYRLSNVLAGIGRGQLRVLEQRVAARRSNFEYYRSALENVPGLTFMPEAAWGRHTRWLTCLTIDPAAFGATREDVRLALEAANIEARPIWKPMHRQPVFEEYARVGGEVAEDIFTHGLCLPSGSDLVEAQLERIVQTIRKVTPHRPLAPRTPAGAVAPTAATGNGDQAASNGRSGAPTRAKHSTGATESPRAATNGAAAPRVEHGPAAERRTESGETLERRARARAPGKPTGVPRPASRSLLPRSIMRHRRPILIALHLLLLPLSYLSALVLRFDFDIPPQYVQLFWSTLPILVGVRLLALGTFEVYNGWLRHVGMYDVVQLIKAITLGSALFVVALFVFGSLNGFPRSVLFLEWIMAVLLLGGLRMVVRWLSESGRQPARRVESRRALIIGAGDVAAGLIRQLRLEPGGGIDPVGMVDDDPAKQGMQIHGLRVLGTTADLPRLVRVHRSRLLIVAIAVANREAMKRIVEICQGIDIDLKVVPSLCNLLNGTTKLSHLRSVQIEDLLGRPAVNLSLDWVRREFEGRSVLITGGAGSIGSELARQIATLRPARLVLVDQAESALYFVHHELTRNYPDLVVVPAIADVTDRRRLDRIFDEFRPECVFHAAAYKHVPMMESNITEAVDNNVFGTKTVVESAAAHGVRRFVLVSTDKAVRPSSVMGATKRVAERLVLSHASLAGYGTDFRAVRFGNVLGSDGSVVPLFTRQIAAGGPVTVTHADATRYFMTIPEAIQLMLQAASLPEAAGRISMLEMGEPVRILDLAENLIRLMGMEPHTEMPIVFTGLRPGEKLHEELMSGSEETIPTGVEKIRIVAGRAEDPDVVQRGVNCLAAASDSNDNDRLLAALCAMTPEAVPPLYEGTSNGARQTVTRGLVAVD